MTSYSDSYSSKNPARDNNFDLLRLTFALFVLYAHSFIIGGFGKEPIANYFRDQETFGSIGVMGFFVISGYLVTQSLIYSKSVITYGIKRFLRLYPAFWVNLLITAFLFAPFVYFVENGSLSGLDVTASNGSISYIKNNFSTLMHDYSISNLLSDNPYKYVFNGSLWTLFLEVKAYIFLGLISLIGIKKNKIIFPTLYLILTLLIIFNVPINSASNKYVRLLIDPAFLVYVTFFFAGTTYYLYKDIIPLSKPLFYIYVIATVISAFAGVLHEFLPISAPYIVIWLAFNLPQSKLSILGKYSYGLYIYAFPVQQMATLLGLNTNLYFYIIICFCFTLVFALLSWYLVENPTSSVKKVVSVNTNLTTLFKKRIS